MSLAKRIVILGAGQAGYSLASKVREYDKSADVVLIGQEKHLPYQRPPLSKQYAKGEMTVEDLTLRPEEWYADNNIRCLTGHRATKIDATAKTVLLEDVLELPYDQLALTIGARPRTLPAKIGGDLKGVYYIRNIDDVDIFRDELKTGHRALVIGGGFIGLEAAAVLSGAGLDVRVVEMADQILQRVVSPQTSGYFRDLHTRNGVTITENVGVSRLIGKDGRVAGAELANGEKIDVDFILVGIGVVANEELANNAGIATRDGILVNAYGQTSVADIYAAGDCARFDYRGQSIRLESVQNSVDQAECVACNIIGQRNEYNPLPWFWSDQFDVELQIAGLNIDYTDVFTRQGTSADSKSMWYFKGKELVAVDAINQPRSFMVAKKILATGRTLLPDQVVDEQFDLRSLLIKRLAH